MTKKDNIEFEWDIRSNDGKVTEGNEWAKELSEHIGKVCLEHGKGFIFAPWGGSNLTCKSFFATNHTDPMMFGAGVAMLISNYMKNNPKLKTDEEKIKWLSTIMEVAISDYKGRLKK